MTQVDPVGILLTMGPVRALATAFSSAGNNLYLVGGPVRDAVLGREIHDLDFTTNARPEQIKVLINQAGADNVFAIGEKFGTISGIFGPDTVEITTFRSEHYDPQSRKPQVKFGDNLYEDLARRDFTMNAMAVDAMTGEMLDPFGGMSDILGRIVRAVGRPLDRFQEDPLRVLRGVRLASQLSFVIERETRLDATNQAEHLQWISKERISQEITKILMTPLPSYGLRMLCAYGMMDFIIPELLEMQGMEQGAAHHKDVFEHTLAVVDQIEPTVPRRWAALLHDIAKPRTRAFEGGKVTFYQHEVVGERMTHQILRRLRMDHNFIWHIGRLVGMHMWANSYDDDWSPGAVRRFVREAREYLDDLVALSAADSTSLRPARAQAAAERVAALRSRVEGLQAEEDVIALDSPLDGDELMEIYGRGPGRWIKDVKERLLTAVLDGEIGPDDKDGARYLADEVMRGVTA
jgi:poly(A) polymerase